MDRRAFLQRTVAAAIPLFDLSQTLEAYAHFLIAKVRERKWTEIAGHPVLQTLVRYVSTLQRKAGYPITTQLWKDRSFLKIMRLQT
jgi:hypothetical protein